MMVPKRSFHEDGGDGLGVLVQESKRRLTFKNVVGDVMRGHSSNEFLSILEPFLRKVVREEVERVILPFLHSSARPSFSQITTSGKRADLQLVFVNKLAPTIFTGSRLEAEEGGPIKIELVDPNTKSVVTASPLSSIKVEILVLDGDFGSDDLDDWSEKEFNTNIVREREGKRPLVTGDRNITLRDGVGFIGDVNFTDNSSWTRSRKFRLGARIVQRIAGELRIKEARSEAFVVKDHRGELYKKHHPPSLNDEIWRLEKIAKDGAFHARLAAYGVHTVRDFLLLYESNPTSLRNIFQSISNRTWETIVEHATECVPDGKLFAYHVATQGVGLLFNSIYKVEGATFGGQNYQPLDQLTLPQMLLVERLKRQAYENVSDWEQFDEPAVVGHLRPLSLQAEPFTVPNLGLQHHDFPIIINQDQLGTQLGFSFPSTSTSYNYEAEDNSQLETHVAQNSHPMQFWPSMLRNSFRRGELFYGENGWSSSATRGAIMPSDHDLAAENNNEFQVSTWSPASTNWGQETNFFFASSSEPEAGIFSPLPPSFGVHMSRIRKPKAAWCKIRAAIKWGSVRRDVAARKMARPLFVGY